MKTIVIMLAIAAIAGAEKMRATLTLDNGTSNNKGIINMAQDGPHAPIIITGSVEGLRSGRLYYGFVHKNANVTDHCKFLGPLDTRDCGRLFLVFTLKVSSMGNQRFVTTERKLSLDPNGSDSIVNRAIGFYDSKKMFVGSDITIPLACGIVHLNDGALHEGTTYL